jgi:hypothetical protein
VVCFPLYIYSEFITNPSGVPLLSAIQGNMAMEDLHRWGKETRWAIITPLLFLLTPMLYMAFRVSSHASSRIILLILALLYPVFGLLKLSRSDIFVGVVNIIFVEYYFRKYMIKPSMKQFRTRIATYILSALTLSILYITLYLRTGMDTLGNLYARAIGFKYDNPSIINETFAQIYGYLALPFENFHLFFESYSGGFNLGISVFRPIMSLLGQGVYVDKVLDRINFANLGGAAGSSTFLTHIYAELGIYGLLFVPLLYGFLVNGLYLRFREKPSFISMFTYMNFVYPWLWLFFNNAFSVLTFYINTLFIVCIYATAGMLELILRRNDCCKKHIH